MLNSAFVIQCPLCRAVAMISLNNKTKSDKNKFLKKHTKPRRAKNQSKKGKCKWDFEDKWLD